MTLGDAWFLALLIPVLALALWAAARPRRAVDGGSDWVLARLPRTMRMRLAWVPGLVGILVAILIIVALARPLRGREEARIITEGIDIMLVVDISSSMQEDGLEQGVTNLDVVKEVVAEFVNSREFDRIGLSTFAAYPRTECPLTLDKRSVIQHLDAVRLVRRNGPEDGTAIGVALGHAARKLKDSDAASRIVVLLTDGEENQYEVDPSEAAALCKDLGIKVYTIGAGRKVGRNIWGQVHEVQLQTDLLETIAADTGGRFYRAKDADVLSQVYAQIDQLERTEREDVRYTDYDDLYHWLLIPAALLLAIELLLRRGPYLELAG